MPNQELLSIDIIKLLNLKSASQQEQMTALQQANLVVMETFFTKVLPTIVPESELDELLKLKDNPAMLDKALADMFVKYPVLKDKLLDVTSDYKVEIMKVLVESFANESRFTPQEAENARQLGQNGKWSELYNLIVSKYH